MTKDYLNLISKIIAKTREILVEIDRDILPLDK